MQLGFIIILIIAIFVAIFAIQNGAPVPLDLFLARYEVPLAVVMMACLILGAIVVLLLGTVRNVKRRSETKELKNKLKTLENDKVLFESNAKAMETEILNLKENNSVLSLKVKELETKQKEQSEIVLNSVKFEENELNLVNELNEESEELTSELIQNEDIFNQEENNKGTEYREYEENSKFEINNEKSEANTNK
ncbi:MAG: Lipopolysaccharide assembly protein domain [Bacillota bacterium]|nr:Lipopolysaccharide assembly protein domain [Bacillota bacterium]